jgi:hypothetical protein
MARKKFEKLKKNGEEIERRRKEEKKLHLSAISSWLSTVCTKHSAIQSYIFALVIFKVSSFYN